MGPSAFAAPRASTRGFSACAGGIRRRTFRCLSDQGRAGRYSSGHAVVLAVGDANIRAVVEFLRTLQGKTSTNAAAKVATGLRCGQEDERARAAHRGRYARQPLGGGRPFGRQSGPAGTALVQDPAQTLDRAAHFPVVGWSQRLSKDYELPHTSTETMICVAFLHLLPRRQCSFLTRS